MNATNKNDNNVNTQLPSMSKSMMYCKKTGAKRLFIDSFALQNPPWEGHFKYVTHGTFTKGENVGECAIIKWIKSKYEGENEYDNERGTGLKIEVKTNKKALQIVTAFNLQRIWKYDIYVIIPEIWKTIARRRGSEEEYRWGHDRWEGVTLLVEPFIKSFKKYNSNKHWCDDRCEMGKVMQSLSHFSYQVTNGDYLLCDIQGGRLTDDVTLTDLAIHSKHYEFGNSDLGMEGMVSFFQLHKCNNYCQPTWIHYY